jgi:hypothetical protein
LFSYDNSIYEPDKPEFAPFSITKKYLMHKEHFLATHHLRFQIPLARYEIKHVKYVRSVVKIIESGFLLAQE